MCATYFAESKSHLIELNQSLLSYVRKIAEKAGEAILTFYKRDDIEVQFKNDLSPLTEADLASNSIITRALKEITTKIPILSEEGKSMYNNDDTFWCVDPLDGTKEFIKQNGEFTVNIALIKNNQPVLGVIHIPVTNITFMAIKYEGAFKVENNQIKYLAKQLAENRQPTIFAVSRSHLNQTTKDFIKQHQAITIAAGSSIKLTLLAEGKADAYPRFGPTSLWDMAAGHAILKETGGEIYKLNQQPLVYNMNEQINPNLIAVRHKNMQFVIEEKLES